MLKFFKINNKDTGTTLLDVSHSASLSKLLTVDLGWPFDTENNSNKGCRELFFVERLS